MTPLKSMIEAIVRAVRIRRVEDLFREECNGMIPPFKNCLEREVCDIFVLRDFHFLVTLWFSQVFRRLINQDRSSTASG